SSACSSSNDPIPAAGGSPDYAPGLAPGAVCDQAAVRWRKTRFAQRTLERRVHHRCAVDLLQLDAAGVRCDCNQRVQMSELNIACREQRPASPLEIQDEPAVVEHA